MPPPGAEGSKNAATKGRGVEHGHDGVQNAVGVQADATPALPAQRPWPGGPRDLATSVPARAVVPVEPAAARRTAAAPGK